MRWSTRFNVSISHDNHVLYQCLSDLDDLVSWKVCWRRRQAEMMLAHANAHHAHRIARRGCWELPPKMGNQYVGGVGDIWWYVYVHIVKPWGRGARTLAGLQVAMHHWHQDQDSKRVRQTQQHAVQKSVLSLFRYPWSGGSTSNFITHFPGNPDSS